MNVIKGITIILLFYFVGQLLSYLMNGFVPGSIIGMLLLFASLHFKLTLPDSVSGTANVLTKNMAVFFIPAGVGLMDSFGVLSEFWHSILIVCSVSTILVIVVVALIQQQMENSRKK